MSKFCALIYDGTGEYGVYPQKAVKGAFSIGDSIVEFEDRLYNCNIHFIGLKRDCKNWVDQYEKNGKKAPSDVDVPVKVKLTMFCLGDRPPTSSMVINTFYKRFRSLRIRGQRGC